MNIFEIKSSTLQHTQIRLKQGDGHLFTQELEKIAAQAPKLFLHANIVLDLSLLSSHTLTQEDLINIQSCIHAIGACFAGIVHASSSQTIIAQALNIPLVYDQKKSKKQTSSPSTPSLHVDKVRTGSELHSGGDIIVLGNVAHGASIYANRSIFVFGKLEGRVSFALDGQGPHIIVANSFNPESLRTPKHALSNADIPHPLKMQNTHCVFDGTSLKARVKNPKTSVFESFILTQGEDIADAIAP